MVRAILDRRKTQTRRVVNLGGIDPDTTVFTGWCGQGETRKAIFNAVTLPGPAGYLRCPYGVPGDRLWVKETCWIDREPIDFGDRGRLRRAFFDDGFVRFEDGVMGMTTGMEPGTSWTPELRRERLKLGTQKLTPSIHMPRWASRIMLEVVGVRVERLQEISGEDAIEEGVTITRCTCDVCHKSSRPCPADASAAIEEYASLWNKINGPGSWASNPWVHVIEFRRVGGAA
jgi:hypothetical protein